MYRRNTEREIPDYFEKFLSGFMFIPLLFAWWETVFYRVGRKNCSIKLVTFVQELSQLTIVKQLRQESS